MSEVCIAARGLSIGLRAESKTRRENRSGHGASWPSREPTPRLIRGVNPRYIGGKIPPW
jgi:hypothetical protein